MLREMKLAKVGAWIALALSYLARPPRDCDSQRRSDRHRRSGLGLLALAWSQMRAVLLTTLVLIGVLATLSLIGWIGLLYVPASWTLRSFPPASNP